MIGKGSNFVDRLICVAVGELVDSYVNCYFFSVESVTERVLPCGRVVYAFTVIIDHKALNLAPAGGGFNFACLRKIVDSLNLGRSVGKRERYFRGDNSVLRNSKVKVAVILACLSDNDTVDRVSGLRSAGVIGFLLRERDAAVGNGEGFKCLVVALYSRFDRVDDLAASGKQAFDLFPYHRVICIGSLYGIGDTF